MTEKLDEALQETKECLDAHENLFDSREVRVMASVADPQITLGTLRALYEAAKGGRELDAVKANLASLNEIITEMTVKVSGDPEFTALVRGLLRDHSHALGFKFRGH